MRRLGHRLLSDQRAVAAIGVIAAVAVAAFVIVGLPKHPAPPVANAQARVLLDTNHSQLVAPSGAEVNNLSLRATLVGDLVASGTARDMLARDAHIVPSELTVIPPSSLEPPAFLTPLTTAAAPLAATTTAPYIVILDTDAETVATPIISIRTQAPDQTAATTLVDATISALRSALGPQSPDQAGSFVVRVVSPPQIIKIPQRSKRPEYAIVGALMIFVLWYAAALLGRRVVSRRRSPQLA